MGKLKIVYKDVAVGADEDAEYSSASANEYSHIEYLSTGYPEDKTATLEFGGWVLDGTYTVREEDSGLSFWSTELSNGVCEFINNPTITISFDSVFTSRGITLEFSELQNRWCSEVNIKWYNASNQLLSDKRFYPDKNLYFCENQVDNYSKIEIEIIKTSLPYMRARLNKIVFGIIYEFGAHEVRDAVLQQEGDLLSNTLSTSTLNWTLDKKETIDFLFQSKQEIEVYDGLRFLGLTYVKSAQRKSKSVYEITSEDAIGLLELEPFNGKVYNNYNARMAIEEILDSEFSLIIDESLASETLTGYILSKVSKREALRQICFALGACVSTMGTDSIKIFKAGSFDDELLDKGEIYNGQVITTKDKITSITLESHSIVRNTSGNIEIDGVKYLDTVTVYSKQSEFIVESDKPNVLELTGMTLVNANNVDKLLNLWYNQEVVRREEATARIVLGNRDIGDNVIIPTLWRTDIQGTISKMTIALSNLTVADVEVK